MISYTHKNSFLYILIGLALFLLQACSSESTAPLNKAFHNTTAHYNAYFIGLDRIKQIEGAIWKAMKPNYNHILMVFPPLDSTMATTYKAEIEDCIKKASIVIQYHKNSKWVDDSYNLIGQARMYGYDFPNAVTTFKYVNTNAKDVNAKHWAIVNLMRIFIENNEFANADEASSYLESEILNKNNLKYLYLTRAYYYQLLDDKNHMVRNLVLADPLLSRQERARYYFIIGQIYQEIGFSSAAYEYYIKCISSNPSYELSFYAKLNIAQVTELSDTKDLKKVRKYFKKLVTDEKNIEFQDRIYYEWAKFELKQNHLTDALEKFNLSVQKSISDPRQKGVSYISLGEIYYNTLKDYSVAQAYYDSAVSVLPTTYEDYKAVKQRQEVLTNFISQINTINLQDSLLRLADMDSTAVMNIFITEASSQQDEKEEKAELEEKQQRTRVGSLANLDEPTGVGASKWYFSNPSAVSAGRTSFRQIWATRPLEDHWRRSIKQAVTTNEENILDQKDIEITKENNPEFTRDQSIMNTASQMYKTLPLTLAEKTEAHVALELAYYNLGKIFYFDLAEKENAGNTFNILHKNYPESEYIAETNYLLYIIYQEQGNNDLASKVADFMHEIMPKSLYTKLIDNPDYEELSNQANEILSKEYKNIYALYLENELDSANKIINKLLIQYPDVKFSANLKLLRILMIGKTQPLADYQLALQSFIDNYPDHELNTYANTLLKASTTYRSNLVKLKAAEYFETSTEKYFYAVLSQAVDHDQNITDLLGPIITADFATYNLKTGSLLLNDSINITLVRQFLSKEDALLFFDSIKAEQLFDNLKNPAFVISESNFDILYKSKEIEAYLEFYRAHF